MDPRKQAICNALATFIRQRPGLGWANYATSNYRESLATYRAEQRSIARDKRDAELLLASVRHHDGITADALLAASQRAFSGRLSILGIATDESKGSHSAPSGIGDYVTYSIDYCTGQYFPTEYRRAAAAVCAAALWDWQRENMPEPGAAPVGSGKAEAGKHWHPEAGRALSPGDWLRRTFRQQFGSALQKRYFD